MTGPPWTLKGLLEDRWVSGSLRSGRGGGVYDCIWVAANAMIFKRQSFVRRSASSIKKFDAAVRAE